MNLKDLSEKVYSLVAQIPRGKVSTYGQIGMVVGVSPRLVGNILHNNPYDIEKVPCHRVVNAVGRLAPAYAFGGAEKQKERLVAEGVVFNDNKVDLSTSLWAPS